MNEHNIELEIDFANKAPNAYAMSVALNVIRSSIIKYEDEYHKSLPSAEILGLSPAKDILTAYDVVRLNANYASFQKAMDTFIEMYNNLFLMFDLALSNEEREIAEQYTAALMDEANEIKKKHKPIL